jgi:flagellar capping protein FliD
MSQVTISGGVSGLDTQSIINQLVSVQGNQQTLLKTRQSSEQSAADALGKLSTALASVGTLAGALAKTSTWTGSTATSSSSSVTATASGTAAGGATCEYRFWRLDPGATTWTLVRDWGTSPTFAYAPLATTAGTYQLAAWARVQTPTNDATATSSAAVVYTLTP